MSTTTEFSAPWGTSLKLLSLLVVALLVAVASVGVQQAEAHSTGWFVGTVVLPLFILAVAIPFVIRGYSVSEGTLKVRRLGWSTRLDLSNLKAVEVDATAMKGSIRILGNGGLFCFAGRFYNKKLGTYRAYATDPNRAVTIKFPERTLVVTPDDPERFAALIKP